MISFRTMAISVLWVAIVSSLGAAQDLSKYRDFEFGMSIESVAKLVAMNPSGAKTVPQSSELIQRLDWNVHGYLDTLPNVDSVRKIRFDFYNGELFKIVVTYDAAETNGLTTDDLVESLSALYGTAGKPETSIIVSDFQTYNDSQRVLAQWENEQYSYNLFRSSYGRSFGLVAFSRRLEAMADATNREAERLDNLEAPAREIARQKKQAEDEQASQEKARLISKPKFRP
jgi:hypothetical protein